MFGKADGFDEMLAPEGTRAPYALVDAWPVSYTHLSPSLMRFWKRAMRRSLTACTEGSSIGSIGWRVARSMACSR